MKLSTLNSKLNLLAVSTNSKTSKGDDDNSLTAIIYMAPNTMSGYDVCPKATKSCIEHCLFTAGRGAMTSVQQARTRKTKLFFEDNDKFLADLHADLKLFTEFCKQEKVQGYVRLNGTSDIDYSVLGVFNKHPELEFYDYTKVHTRTTKGHSNYHLTYSRGEDTTLEEIATAIENSVNVAVVFDTVPAVWKGYKVIEGDLTDMRAKDEVGVIVGLTPKGKLKKSLKDSSHGGFVVELNNPATT